jgi:hypothetical protein
VIVPGPVLIATVFVSLAVWPPPLPVTDNVTLAGGLETGTVYATVAKFSTVDAGMEQPTGWQLSATLPV